MLKLMPDMNNKGLLYQVLEFTYLERIVKVADI